MRVTGSSSRSLLLSACGFQLRGAYTLPFDTLYIALPETSELRAIIKRNIEASTQTRVVADAKEAQATLIDPGRRAGQEHPVAQLGRPGARIPARAHFHLPRARRQGPGLRAGQPDHPSRATSPSTTRTVLSKEAEEALLWRDIQNDLVQQLLRRLAAAKRKTRGSKMLPMQLRPEQLAAPSRQAARAALCRARRRAAADHRGRRRHPRRRAPAGLRRARGAGGDASPSAGTNCFMAAGNLSLFGGDKLVDLRIPSGKPGRDGGEALAALLRAAAGRHRHPDHPAGDSTGRRRRPPGSSSSPTPASPSNATRRRCRSCRPGSPSAWRASSRARRARRSISSPPTSKATCSPRTRKSRSSACSTRPARFRWRNVEAAVLNVARYDIDELRDALRARRHRALRAHARRPEGRRRRPAAGAVGAGQRGAQQPRRRAPALLHAARIDRMIKGVATGDIWDELLQLALRLTQTRTA